MSAAQAKNDPAGNNGTVKVESHDFNDSTKNVDNENADQEKAETPDQEKAETASGVAATPAVTVLGEELVRSPVPARGGLDRRWRYEPPRQSPAPARVGLGCVGLVSFVTTRRSRRVA